MLIVVWFGVMTIISLLSMGMAIGAEKWFAVSGWMSSAVWAGLLAYTTYWEAHKAEDYWRQKLGRENEESNQEASDGSSTD